MVIKDPHILTDTVIEGNNLFTNYWHLALMDHTVVVTVFTGSSLRQSQMPDSSVKPFSTLFPVSIENTLFSALDGSIAQNTSTDLLSCDTAVVKGSGLSLDNNTLYEDVISIVCTVPCVEANH